MARGLLAAIVALNLGIVGINVLINQWNAAFFNALQAKDFAAFDVTYVKGIAEANRYHVETGHPEIVWKLPPEPPRHLDLGPQPGPAKSP